VNVCWTSVLRVSRTNAHRPRSTTFSPESTYATGVRFVRPCASRGDDKETVRAVSCRRLMVPPSAANVKTAGEAVAIRETVAPATAAWSMANWSASCTSKATAKILRGLPPSRSSK